MYCFISNTQETDQSVACTKLTVASFVCYHGCSPDPPVGPLSIWLNREIRSLPDDYEFLHRMYGLSGASGKGLYL